MRRTEPDPGLRKKPARVTIPDVRAYLADHETFHLGDGLALDETANRKRPAICWPPIRRFMTTCGASWLPGSLTASPSMSLPPPVWSASAWASCRSYRHGGRSRLGTCDQQSGAHQRAITTREARWKPCRRLRSRLSTYRSTIAAKPTEQAKLISASTTICCCSAGKLSSSMTMITRWMR